LRQSTSRPNISIFLPDLKAGGAERLQLTLAEEFSDLGHTVEFVLLEKQGELLSAAEARFNVYELECKRMRQAPLRLTRYLKERSPRVLLAAMWPITCIAGLAMRLAGRPCRLVASEHSDFREMRSLTQSERFLLKHFGTWLYGCCDTVVAVSNGVRESLEEVARLPHERVTVINNAVRPLKPERMSNSDRLHLRPWLESEYSLIAIGALKPAKGFDNLLRALSHLRKRCDARLLILGEGPLRLDLERLAANLDVSESVYLPGFRSNPGVFLKHSDVFVLSSNWEGFGNVIVEALAAQIPVVATNCRSGPAEILEGGRYGRLVPVGDPVALSQAIEEILSGKNCFLAAQERAQDFSPRRVARSYLEVLL
jgi:glycosyltransferase involved in cell wall biosynthesis